jgi:hypothetical protein
MKVRFFNVWLGSYVVTHIALWARLVAPAANGSDSSVSSLGTAFEKYVDAADPHLVAGAAACYVSKSAMALLTVLLQSDFAGLDFEVAASVAFSAYAALLPLLLLSGGVSEIKRTPWLYLMAAGILLVEQLVEITGGEAQRKRGRDTVALVLALLLVFAAAVTAAGGMATEL